MPSSAVSRTRVRNSRLQLGVFCIKKYPFFSSSTVQKLTASVQVDKDLSRIKQFNELWIMDSLITLLDLPV
ncbi:hypothetical protein L1987_57085 [Smallanthus sonchifolius]|uniref:Uncharacterized protein n=1 Tax=Smallanthus sonchifolius TaxID=185202 RepID=A0ACB9DC16_9ASTR|nr:hypothetical protein L1987_57085 [Smallanthus sonchifolius]